MTIGKLSTALAALMLSAAGASAANVDFVGTMCLTSVTPGCVAAGWNVGNCAVLRVRPSDLGTNGPATKVSLFWQSFALNYQLDSGDLVGTTYQIVRSTHLGQSAYTFNARMRVTRMTPATLSETTQFATFVGNIKNFDDPSLGCDVGFKATAQRKP